MRHILPLRADVGLADTVIGKDSHQVQGGSRDPVLGSADPEILDGLVDGASPFQVNGNLFTFRVVAVLELLLMARSGARRFPAGP